ncbi:MAG TPA: HDOD domain-containing protein, partial [Fimbriimonas sp.]|nr:HDOD domain-containing protein [Fimbriimonas sp.]
MMNLLFVDDEVAILESLSDSLRCRRGEWTCHFAASGKEALELLSTKEFDIVVSDMRMPGMDGAEFLAAVQERWPKIARLILSGQADSDSLTRALPVTHQFLAKPCEPDKLIQTVGTILELRSRTHDRAVLEIVGKSGTLPSLEPHLAKLSELLATGGSSSQIAEVVACDLALSSRILQVANSPYFGPSRSISSLAEAISFTGLNLLKSILISCQARRLAPGASAQQLAAFSERDLKIATLARTITAYAPDAEQAFSVGLLSNIGQYVLLQTDPMRYPQLLRT